MESGLQQGYKIRYPLVAHADTGTGKQPMTYKQRALKAFTKNEMLEIATSLGLAVSSRNTVDELRDELNRSKRASLARILPLLSRDQLKAVCSGLGLSPTGTEKQVLIDRILGEPDEGKRAADGQQPDLLLQLGTPKGPSSEQTISEDSQAPRKPMFISPLMVKKEMEGQGQIDSRPPPPPNGALTSNAPSPLPKASRADRQICIEVEPRQPQLAWQGMDRKPAVLPVPTQIVEIVRPGRAVDRGEQLAKIDTRAVQERDMDRLPPNRLIWTNDNLVALRTLLDEKDPETGDYRYRGKVDLVYIDPPFMVNNDFRADNSIDIELDDEEGVQAKKEPSLVEILAYKDTWRQGLDSFLSMLRQRLELLKELLAPTGSIYVHLDWHAVHYVKVMMDGIFGYENFRNEIVWKRTFARADAQGFNQVHDTILAYGMSDNAFWNPVYGPHSIEYIKSHYNQIDEKTGRRYRYTSMESPRAPNSLIRFAQF